MRIGIVGYGKMGILLRQKALIAGHSVPVVIDPRSSEKEVTNRKLIANCLPLDVIIDFTEADAFLDNLDNYVHFKVPAVVGTTGWYDQMDLVAGLVEESEIGLIWSGNYSLGVNLFFRLVKEASRLMDRFSQYDPAVHEWHHRYKKDSPSGTAEMLGAIIIGQMSRKNKLVKDIPQRLLEDDELQISSTRCGSVPGSHRVVFDSEVDSVVLEHCARNRNGFAEGALLAAAWIIGKKGFFSIDDLISTIIGGEDEDNE